jgi:hypothetical protein
MVIQNKTTSSLSLQQGTKTDQFSSVLPVSTRMAGATSLSPLAQAKVFLMFPSRYSGRAGTDIDIQGSGFTAKNNTVYFGNHEVSGITSWNGASLSVKAPSIPKGIYPLSVKNAQGESNTGAFFVVTDGTTAEPAIESIIPPRALLGSTVVVRGSGFTATGNMVRTGAEVLENIPSLDGTTISFRTGGKAFESLTERERIWAREHGATFPLWVHVVNENGVSKHQVLTLAL